jgi:hypothetical protein
VKGNENTFHNPQDLLHMSYTDHLPEFKQDWDDLPEYIPGLEVRVLKEFDYDGRRFWRLATVWYQGVAFMVIQNAGREGDDHAQRFVTNFERLFCLVRNLDELARGHTSGEPLDEIDVDQDMPELTEFYSQNLKGPWKRQDPRF